MKTVNVLLVMFALSTPAGAQSLGVAGDAVDSELGILRAAVDGLTSKVAALETTGGGTPEVSAILVRLDAIDAALLNLDVTNRVGELEAMVDNLDLGLLAVLSNTEAIEEDYGVRIGNAEKKAALRYWRINLVEMRTDPTGATVACWDSGGTPNIDGDPVCVCPNYDGRTSSWLPSTEGGTDFTCTWDDPATSTQPPTPSDLP